MPDQSVLVGDVGGTNVRFAVARRHHGKLQLDSVTIYKGTDIPSFSDAVGRFTSSLETIPNAALFALAGPLREDGTIIITNREWPVIDPKVISSRFGIENVRIVNDFAAMARAIPELDDDQFELVAPGKYMPDDPILVTGPGTGFGISTLLRKRNGWITVTGEGGHTAFAPRTQREFDIMSIIARDHDYVSTEMIVSGKWLNPVYAAVCELHRETPKDLSPQHMLDLATAGDPVTREVCEFRARAVLGAAGDAALICGAKGGIVLTGGVAERIVPWLRDDAAIARLRNRGDMSAFLADTPVRVMMNNEAPLLGAAALQLELES